MPVTVMRKLALTLLCAVLHAGITAAAPHAGAARRLEPSAASPSGSIRIPLGKLVLDVSLCFSDTVRIRMASPSSLDALDRSYAVVTPRPSDPGGTVVERMDGATRIVTLTGTECAARVVVRPDGQALVSVLDAAGEVVVEDAPEAPPRVDADSGSVEVSKVRPRDQFVYGFGEKPLPMDRTSFEVVQWNSDTPAYRTGTDPTYQSTPFYIGLRRGKAYGLFFDNTHRSYFNVGKRNPERITFGAPGGFLDSYVFCGGPTRDPRQVVRRYTELTGRSQLPPLWALGYQQSRWGYYPEKRVRDLAARFRATRTPCDAIYLDIDYMNGYRVFTWDASRFPDPKALVTDLKRDGFHTVVIIDPGIKVDDAYGVYRSGQAAGVFVRRQDGSEFRGPVWPGTCAFPDFTSSAARKWWGAQFAGLVGVGIAGFWTDMNEPSVFLPPDFGEPWTLQHPAKTFPPDTRHDGDGQPDSHARYHNVYGQQMTRATHDGVLALAPERRPFVLTRATYAGGQRYAASWTGDNIATWEHLELTIPMLLTMGLNGQSMVGADVGGFVDAPTPELYARWLQAACLTPIMRSHTVTGTPDQEPFSYGDGYADLNRATIELRYELMPYLYTQFEQAERTGEPVMRPLWLDTPSDPRVLLVDDQFLVGRDLLVAPVLRPGIVARRVVFPTGNDWVDWYTGNVHKGGTEADVPAPANRLPLFVRAGALVPTRAPAPHTGAQLAGPVTLRVFPGGEGLGNLFEDPGDGFGYRADRRADTTFSQSIPGDGLRTLVIGARRGAFRPAAATLVVELVTAEGTLLRVAHNGTELATQSARTRDGLHVVRITLPNDGQARTLEIKPAT